MPTLTPGTRLGPYEVVGSLGAGGMGVVYRARDVNLGRDVALKILPDLFASDPERVARFDREAQVLASLNHPNIAAIYGLERDASASASVPGALVMELVEGPTLAERIAMGPMLIPDALPIAEQIAQALEAAHDLGIVHRDLKPANIKLRPDGTVKVLDFGLAKIAEPSADPARSASASLSPTLSFGATQAGMILGTAAYMSPEQARGRPVDKRADVWAFGAVLYEMLTGRKAFPGDDISDTLATILKFEPDWTRLPAETPPSIRRLLKRCLTKDPKRRLRDCGSALVELLDAQSDADSDLSGTNVTGIATAPARRLSIPLMLAALTLAAAAGAAALWAVTANRATTTSPPVTTRFTIELPEGLDLPRNSGTLIELSPDGRTLVYRAGRGSDRRLFRRNLDQFESSIVTSEDASEVFFSPDSQWIGFLSGESLRKLRLAGGPAQTLATVPRALRGAVWTADGRIVFANNNNNPAGRLLQVPAMGGAVVEIFTAANQESVAYPQVLPGGRAVLFTLVRGGESALHLLQLDTNEVRLIEASGAAGRVLPTGHLVFVREGALWGVPFDLTRLETAGTPVPVIEGIRVERGGAIQYVVADDGTLVYIPGDVASRNERRLALVGSDGRAAPLSAPARDYVTVALAADRTNVAVQIGLQDEADVWAIDVDRGAVTRVTTDPGFDGSPLWSPDGRSLVFASARDGRWSINRRLADGTGSVEPLAVFDPKVTNVRPTSWTPDGRLVFTMNEDVAVLSGKDGGWQSLIETPAFENHAVVSPDGRLIAYASDESGTGEVYVQRFPDLRDRHPVSVGGGHTPVWSPDGRAIYYLRGGPPREIMRVTVQLARDGRIEIGKPEHQVDWVAFFGLRGERSHDVMADGRFLVLSTAPEGGDTASRRMHVVLNWSEELKRLVPLPQ